MRYGVGAYLRRLRHVRPLWALRFLRPRRVDWLLYRARRDEARSFAPCASVPVAVEHLTGSMRCGVPEIDQELDLGREGFVARVDGDAVSWMFVFHDVWLPVQFGHPGGHPFLGGSYTREAHRGRRIYSHLLHYATCAVLERHPDRDVYALVEPGNVPPQRALARIGFRELDRLQGLQLGPMVLRRPRRSP